MSHAIYPWHPYWEQICKNSNYWKEYTWKTNLIFYNNTKWKDLVNEIYGMEKITMRITNIYYIFFKKDGEKNGWGIQHTKSVMTLLRD